MPEPTLYERLGGVYAIAAVVDHFSDEIVQKHSIEKNNPYIKDWNTKKAGYRLPGLKFLRTLWLCAIAGGPFQYTGKALGDAHFDFQLTPGEFDEIATELARSLDHFKVPKREKEEVLGAFATYKPAVTAGSILR
ncbi:MAG TPA: group 1 truncated hemoglobin [Thermoplasmata archaeon]